MFNLFTSLLDDAVTRVRRVMRPFLDVGW